jgi:hypothetical protein
VLDTTHTQQLESRINYTALLGYATTDKTSDDAVPDLDDDPRMIGGGA